MRESRKGRPRSSVGTGRDCSSLPEGPAPSSAFASVTLGGRCLDRADQLGRRKRLVQIGRAAGSDRLLLGSLIVHGGDGKDREGGGHGGQGAAGREGGRAAAKHVGSEGSR